jgi:hypothetical protein
MAGLFALLVNAVDLDSPCKNAYSQLSEFFSEVVAIEKVNWWRTIPRRFLYCGGRECSSGNKQALVSAALHRAAKIAYLCGANGAFIPLALEQHMEAH